MQTHSLSHNNSTPPPSIGTERIRQVAEEFEAMFASMMVRAMRKTVADGGLFEKNLGEKVYTEMLDDEYAKRLAGNGSLGLADLIVKEIERRNPDLAALKGLQRQPWEIDNGMVPTRAPREVNARALHNRIKQWNELIENVAGEFDLDPNLVRAVMAQESAGNPHAVSTAGAKGLMQLIDSTAKDMGVSRVFDPEQNIRGGVKYLRMLLDRFEGNQPLALAAYNAGPSAVDKYRGIPPYRETQNYVSRVTILKNRFDRMAETRSTATDIGQTKN